MPLPPALANKLAKRGLITSKLKPDNSKNSAPPKGYEGCPNKYNIYHECNKFCTAHWKVGVLEPAPKYLLQRERLLKRYPLPITWKEVYDRGCGRFYYWDTKNDVVSWLPPKHPNANVNFSAADLREGRLIRAAEQIDKPEEKRKRTISEEREVKKHNNKTKNYRKSTNLDLHLDPMDPAAYSDIPRGTWSSGLEMRAEAKTGVDQTASGTLYQTRPYPSPGAVLADNAKNKHLKNKDKEGF